MKTECDYEICSMITFSTGHISQEDAYLLANNELAISREEGWILYINHDEEAYMRYSEELRKLLAIAKTWGCDYLMLDSDGLIYPHLKQFNW